MQREGIEVLFGLAGGPIQDIMGWAPHCGVRPIGVRHEQAATFAAAAYGYVKNQVGVAVLAAGPGVTNGVTGAHVAYDNCLPLLILGGSGPQKGRGTGTFQETENVPMFKSITKMAVQVDSTARLPEYLAMGFGRHAPDGRAPSIWICLPTCCRARWKRQRSAGSPTTTRSHRPWAIRTRSSVPSSSARRTPHAHHWEGGALVGADPGAPAARRNPEPALPDVAMGRGFIPDDHPLNFGAARSTMMGHADVIGIVGSRLNWVFGFGRQFLADAKLIHIDIEPEEIGANRGVEVGIIDAKVVLQQLLAELTGKTPRWRSGPRRPRLAALREQVEQNAKGLAPLLDSDATPIRTHRLLREVRDIFPRETIYTVDGQLTLASGRQVLGSYTPASRLNLLQRVHGCRRALAIGAKLARPESRW